MFFIFLAIVIFVGLVFFPAADVVVIDYSNVIAIVIVVIITVVLFLVFLFALCCSNFSLF